MNGEILCFDNGAYDVSVKEQKGKVSFLPPITFYSKVENLYQPIISPFQLQEMKLALKWQTTKYIFTIFTILSAEWKRNDSPQRDTKSGN